MPPGGMPKGGGLGNMPKGGGGGAKGPGSMVGKLPSLRGGSGAGGGMPKPGGKTPEDPQKKPGKSSGAPEKGRGNPLVDKAKKLADTSAPTTKKPDEEKGLADKAKDKALAAEHEAVGKAGAAAGTAVAGPVGAEVGEFAAKKVNKFVIDHKNQIAAGLIALAMLPVILVMMFVVLFKNLSIKRMMLAAGHAALHAATHNRVTKLLGSAIHRAAGTVDTIVNLGDSPKKQLSMVNKADMDSLAAGAINTEDLLNQIDSIQQSPDGVGGEVWSQYGVDNAIDSSDRTDNDDETQKKAQASIQTGIIGNEKPEAESGDAQDAADAALEAASQGTTHNKDLSDIAADKYLKDTYGTLEKLEGPEYYGNLVCIISDLYEKRKTDFSKVRLASAARTTANEAKYADAWTQGDLSLAENGAMADLADDDHGSFMDSAGANRALYEPVTGQDLDERWLPKLEEKNGDLGKLYAKARKMNAKHSTVKGKWSDFNCALRETTLGKAGYAVVNGVKTLFKSLASLNPFDRDKKTPADVLDLQADAREFNADAIRIIAKQSVMQYKGLMYTGRLEAEQWGNTLHLGAKVLAETSCQRMGCKMLNPAEHQAMQENIRRDRIASFQKKPLAYRLFSLESPDSVLSHLVLRTPTDPAVVIARMGNGLTTLLQPRLLASAIGNFALNAITPARAGDVEYQTYNVPDFGIPNDQLEKYDVEENSDWVDAHISDKEKEEMNKCFTTPMPTLLEDLDDNGKPNPGSLLEKCNSDDEKMARYRIYRFDQYLANALALRFNHQSGSGYTRGGGSSTNTVAGQAPSGDVQSLAQQMLATKNIKYWTNNGINTHDVVQALANGQPAYTTCGNAPNKTADINPNILKFILQVAQTQTIMVNALTDKCHSGPGSKHYSGEAVDLDNQTPNHAQVVATAANYGGTKNSESDHMHFDFPKK